MEGRPVGFLAAATVVLALMSEVLTDSLEPATQQLGINEVFAGVILLASVSNVSSIMNAAVFARKNQMDLAVSSVIGAATQIALLVAPALVFASLLMPEPMDLLFNRLELVALIISVFTARNMTIDGKSDWLEGAMLDRGLRDARHRIFLFQLAVFVLGMLIGPCQLRLKRSWCIMSAIAIVWVRETRIVHRFVLDTLYRLF